MWGSTPQPPAVQTLSLSVCPCTSCVWRFTILPIMSHFCSLQCSFLSGILDHVSGSTNRFVPWGVHAGTRMYALDFYPRDVVSAVLATATWLAGWLAGCLSVTRRYCIKMAKPILKHFRPSGSPIILVSSDPCADTQFQGEPLQRRL